MSHMNIHVYSVCAELRGPEICCWYRVSHKKWTISLKGGLPYIGNQFALNKYANIYNQRNGRSLILGTPCKYPLIGAHHRVAHVCVCVLNYMVQFAACTSHGFQRLKKEAGTAPCAVSAHFVWQSASLPQSGANQHTALVYIRRRDTKNSLNLRLLFRVPSLAIDGHCDADGMYIYELWASAAQLCECAQLATTTREPSATIPFAVARSL